MRVRTVSDLGTDGIYLKNRGMLLVDADLTEAEHDELVRMARARYESRGRHLRPV